MLYILSKKTLATGCNVFISKPIDTGVLKSLVKKYL